jgi:proline iminopeptidase
MKKTVYLIVLILTQLSIFSQKLDSIKYANGYLYYHDNGKGDPILILAGGPGINCIQEQEVADELSKTYRTILLEQRGTGRAMPVPFDSTTITLQGAMDDINLLLNYLQLKSIVIYGHSWGGMLGMSYASYYPKKVKSLILVGTGYYKLGEPDEKWTLAFNRFTRWGKLEFAINDSLFEIGKIRPLTEAEQKKKRRLGISANIYEKDYTDSMTKKITIADINLKTLPLMFSDMEKNKYDLSKPLIKYKRPIIAICGRQDPLANYTYELKILRPTTQLKWIQQCGHFPMFEKRDEFYKVLKEALITLNKK